MMIFERQSRFCLVLIIICIVFYVSDSLALGADKKRQKHSFRIHETKEQYLIDGKLDELFWKKAELLGGFRVDADPGRFPDAQTSVYITYNENALLVAFICNEPMMNKLKADVASKNLETWKGDYCELQVFSRPETPYYSPFMQRLDYMNANDKARTQRHFIVTAANARQDGNIYKVGPHTQYITDDSWEGEWESAVSMEKDRYVIEMSVPWIEIGGIPRPGHTFKLGFMRHRQESAKEISRFNWYSGENIRVDSFDPASFTQEHPIMFAPVRLEQEHAILTRFVETKDPWAVDRPYTEYESVLTNRQIELRAAHYYLGIRGFLLPEYIIKQYTDQTWAAEENNFITELGNAGANGPFLPGFMNKVGEAGLDSLYKRYGMQFGYHGYASSNQAKKAGATILRPRGTVAFFDPHYVDIKNKMLEDWLKKYGMKPWLFDIRGQDEPFNQIATILQPGTIDLVNKD
ncbi:MAG TPA: hypothetical protein ENI27_07940, partial [bacterium]|nr:hypothetical protein [bacterium]